MNIKSILEISSGYTLFQNALITNRYNETFLRALKLTRNAKVLDIGCGPGDILNLLGDVKYTGIDISQEYINSAKKDFGTRGDFYCVSVKDLTNELITSPFDIIFAKGVVHHLDDDEAGMLFAKAYSWLKPSGRLVTRDPCFVKGQSLISLKIIQNDRGRYVRTKDQYLKLASRNFKQVTATVHQNLLRIPYVHCDLICSK